MHRGGGKGGRVETVKAMTSDLDIYRTANLLLKQYGNDGAWMHAAMRADELLEAGDMDGRGVWIKVLETVREWSSRELPGDGEAVH